MLRGGRKLRGQRGLAGAGRADEQGASTFLDAAAEQRVEALERR